ncbi:hypothetical protein CEXT_388621 [Caerostris extrusa]|uniref:Uncharacterized protein n=1 Tax=Caerostris extrusa TaxID=172846 RepID=A0AAV4TBT4_CAEEX|nr:hypothetical protein CEXT_388621 [Caerostris extrusa]
MGERGWDMGTGADQSVWGTSDSATGRPLASVCLLGLFLWFTLDSCSSGKMPRFSFHRPTLIWSRAVDLTRGAALQLLTLC